VTKKEDPFVAHNRITFLNQALHGTIHADALIYPPHPSSGFDAIITARMER